MGERQQERDSVCQRVALEGFHDCFLEKKNK
jgi:hypothetical protein